MLNTELLVKLLGHEKPWPIKAPLTQLLLCLPCWSHEASF